MEIIRLRHAWGAGGALREQWQDQGCHSSSPRASRGDSWPSATTMLGGEGLVTKHFDQTPDRLKAAEPPQ